ncbi:MAG: hypothetical protein ACN4GR_11160 [Arenicellales bacterium]
MRKSRYTVSQIMAILKQSDSGVPASERLKGPEWLKLNHSGPSNLSTSQLPAFILKVVI